MKLLNLINLNGLGVMSSKPVAPKYVKVYRRNPLFRDQVYGENLLSGVLVLKARSESYIHVTSSPIPFMKPSKELLTRFREEIKSAIDVSQIIDIASRYPAFKGIVLEQIRFGGKPVIPGSSLKGAVRSRLELLIAEKNGISIACFIRASPPPRTTPSKGRHGWRHMELWFDVISENRGRPCDATRWSYYEEIEVCRICDLFGTSGLVSRVDFGTLYPVLEEDATEELEVIFSCSRGIKGRVEAIKPSIEFRGEIAFKGLKLSELGLLALGLRLYDDRPILIGRFKYKRVPVCRDKKLLLELFGRLNIYVEEVRMPLMIKDTISKLDIEYEIDGINIVLREQGVKNLIDLAINEAYREYSDYLPNKTFDEISKLEKIWNTYERGRENECRC